MINHIDVSSVLRRTVCDLYSNLVTRSTGQAVRSELEHQLRETPGPTLTVIDFSNVGLLDYSCADEVVAKLLCRFVEVEHSERGGEAAAGDEVYFLFRGVQEAHREAIEHAIERYGLALVAESEHGEPLLVGAVGEGERRAWEVLYRLGAADADAVTVALGAPTDERERVAAALARLHRRRLVMRLDGRYVALGAVG